MIDIIWDIFQQVKIKGIQGQADYAREKTLDNSHNHKDLETRHEELKLVTLAMWELLKSHTGMGDGDLRKFVSKVDLKDGKKDGKRRAKNEILNCDKCGKKVLNTSVSCLFCTHPNSNYSPADIFHSK